MSFDFNPSGENVAARDLHGMCWVSDVNTGICSHPMNMRETGKLEINICSCSLKSLFHFHYLLNSIIWNFSYSCIILQIVLAAADGAQILANLYSSSIMVVANLIY